MDILAYYAILGVALVVLLLVAKGFSSGSTAQPSASPRAEPAGRINLCDVHPATNATPDELAELGRVLIAWLTSRSDGTTISGLHALCNGHRPVNPYATVYLEVVDGVLRDDPGDGFPAKVSCPGGDFDFAERAGTVRASLEDALGPMWVLGKVTPPSPFHNEAWQR